MANTGINTTNDTNIVYTDNYNNDDDESTPLTDEKGDKIGTGLGLRGFTGKNDMILNDHIIIRTESGLTVTNKFGLRETNQTAKGNVAASRNSISDPSIVTLSSKGSDSIKSAVKGVELKLRLEMENERASTTTSSENDKADRTQQLNINTVQNTKSITEYSKCNTKG